MNSLFRYYKIRGLKSGSMINLISILCLAVIFAGKSSSAGENATPYLENLKKIIAMKQLLAANSYAKMIRNESVTLNEFSYVPFKIEAYCLLGAAYEKLNEFKKAEEKYLKADQLVNTGTAERTQKGLVWDTLSRFATKDFRPLDKSKMVDTGTIYGKVLVFHRPANGVTVSLFKYDSLSADTEPDISNFQQS